MTDVYQFLAVAVDLLWFTVGALIHLFLEICHQLRQTFAATYKDLTNDVVLITGAANGLGRLLALEFSQYCNHIVLWDIDEVSLNETTLLVQTQSPSTVVQSYVCDLRDSDEINRTATRVLEDVGRVTVLVNNAGIVNGKTMLELSSTEIQDCFNVNVLSHFHTIKAFLPSMIAQSMTHGEAEPGTIVNFPRGHIVTVASIAGVIPGVGLSDYCASKAAALLASESLQLELIHRDLDRLIGFTRVLPSLLDTKMFAGCYFSRPWFFPIVEASWCARRIVRAVRTGEDTVYAYPRYRILPLCKFLLPTKVLVKLFNYAGSEHLLSQLKMYREQGKNRQ